MGVKFKNKDANTMPIATKEKINKIINDFMGITRECPICYEEHDTKGFVFQPCSHFCCVDCFKKLEDNKCFMCKEPAPVCIRYEKVGDVLKFSPRYNLKIDLTVIDAGNQHYNLSITEEHRRTMTFHSACFLIMGNFKFIIMFYFTIILLWIVNSTF